MREMKDSGSPWLGTIPQDWNVLKVKNLVRRKTDKNMPDEQVLSLYRELGIVIKEDRDDNHNVTSENTDNYRFVEVNDLVVNKMKAWQGSIAVSAYQGIVSPAYYVYRFTSQKCYPWYVHYVLRCTAYLPEYRRLSGGIRLGQWDLSDDNFKNIPLPIPVTFDEQKKIADYLDSKCSKIDEIIAKQEQIIEKLKEYKLSVITEAVTKGLDPDVEMKDSGVEWIGGINRNYSLSRIGRFCFVTKLAGFEYTDTMVDRISEQDEVPIVRAQHVRMFKFDKDSISEYIDYKTSLKLERCSLDRKCLLITFIGAGIGDVCIFDDNKRYHLAPNVAKIVIRDNFSKILSEEYLMYYLGSYAGKGEINKIAKASAQPSLSMETIRSITIVLPPLEAQHMLVEYLDKETDKVDKSIKQREQIILKMQEYKKSLIYEVVTGKKEV